ncbi:DUF4135 domain-containing protein [Chitinophaga caseinilytica]|uniref:DUF4135 domain-containing protein n=1 Tax=Chitinophaga caseinilytica TaxID=2267521 RepID=A0ABZ2ZED7_9BACT
MNRTQLEAILRAMGVTPPDVNRASLYLDYLQQAQTFFQTTLAANIGAPNYSFVRTAVRSANLLNEMAAMFDLYIGAAVDAALLLNVPNNETYQQYFDNNILTPGYPGTRNTFRGIYTVSTNALLQLYNHFTGNIQQACQRVYADRNALGTFFDELSPNTTNVVWGLSRIKSTGSDFHKGGKQVLIFTLTVDVTEAAGDTTMTTDKRIVYKPSDIETDCLLAGKSAVINAITPGFMTASLFEIYNTQLAAYKLANPAFTGLPVTTYGILPRSFQSAHVGGPPLPVRAAYGYLEYLNNDLSGTTIQYNGYFPFAQSDYMIFKSQNAAAITQAFYRTEGATAALACSFSIQDLHLENVRVKGYLPYLIDMEVSLAKASNSIESTVLIANVFGLAAGGINGLYLDAQEFGWSTPAPTASGANCYLDQDYETVFYQNRLWTWSGTRNKQNVMIDQPSLLTGFADGMTVLAFAEQNLAFNGWFARLNNVVVRYLPYPTSFFKNSFVTPYYLNPMNATGNAYTLQQLITGELTAKANNYVPGANPDFLSLAGVQCLTDLQQVDIPIYYYRIGMQEIIDSNGAQVPIPATVTINNAAPPPATVPFQVAPVLGRATFLANIPTTTIVYQAQVFPLANPPGNPARSLLLTPTITNALAAGGMNPQQVIPVN